MSILNQIFFANEKGNSVKIIFLSNSLVWSVYSESFVDLGKSQFHKLILIAAACVVHEITRKVHSTVKALRHTKWVNLN